MADVCGLTVIKKIPYRGNALEEWSNQYWLSGGIPSGPVAWRALFDAMVTQEKTCFGATSSVIRGYGYTSDAPDAPAVWSVDLTVAPDTPISGTMSTTSATATPGDAAAWLRWKTSRLNTKGKPIYLRKYFHSAYYQTGSPDTTAATQVTALNAFGTKLMDGSFLDARTLRSQTHAETLLSRTAGPFITTRTLKRRGKRPGA